MHSHANSSRCGMNRFRHVGPRLSWALFGILVILAGTAAIQGQIITIPHPNPPLQSGDFGSNLANVGDLDDNGMDDFAVSALYEDGQTTYSGKVYIYSGGTTPTLIRSLISPNVEEGGSFTYLCVLPDITGDGKAEIVVGAPNEDTGQYNSGRVYIFSGADSGPPIRTLVPPNPVSQGSFGRWLAPAPDMNGDGFPELIISVSEPGSYLGRVHVFSAVDGGLLYTKTSPNPQSNGGLFGGAIAGLPDLNGDGRGDFIVGAQGEDVGSKESAGRAYVFSGINGALLRTHVSPSVTAYGGFGARVLAMGDINYDGLGDYVISAPPEGALSAGRVHVYSGATGQLIRTLSSPSPVTIGSFGTGLAAIPDMSGDGMPDLAVGAYREPQGNTLAYGRFHLFRSDNWSLLQTLASPNQQIYTGYGIFIAGLHDFNGDGLGETLVSGPGELIQPDRSYAGRAYLHLAPPAPPTLTPSPIPSPSPSPSPTPAAAIDWEIYN